MKTLRSLLLTFVMLFGLIATSCINDDIDSTPGLSLGFSTDTVSFGTVFTDVSSPTARLIVRNPAKKGVSISSIRFKDSSTPFSLNVDGINGTVFHDVEIRGGDSIYVFIECLLEPDQAIEPRRVSDQLQFTLNGRTQDVEVEALAQNVRRLRAAKIDTDMTLDATLPYLIYDSITVERGATLKIEPGAKLLFHDKAGITVKGRIEAVGEAGRMIDMRGDRLDNVLPDVGYDILSGQWRGIRIAAGSFGNRLEFVDMRSTTDGLQLDSCADLSQPKLTLLNSWLHNSQGNVLKATGGIVNAYGTCFSESPLAVVSLSGGNHKFVQCTVANNYLFAAVSQANLLLENVMPDGGDAPAMNASFENCIIYGLGQPMSPGDLIGSEVFLRNVLIKGTGTDDANFINCLWDVDPLFETVREDYYFNYRLQDDSPAIGAGNPEFVTPECRYDMDGIDRLANGNPALGAYAK